MDGCLSACRTCCWCSKVIDAKSKQIATRSRCLMVADEAMRVIRTSFCEGGVRSSLANKLNLLLKAQSNAGYQLILLFIDKCYLRRVALNQWAFQWKAEPVISVEATAGNGQSAALRRQLWVMSNQPQTAHLVAGQAAQLAQINRAYRPGMRQH
jgi:hypothetical protein